MRSYQWRFACLFGVILAWTLGSSAAQQTAKKASAAGGKAGKNEILVPLDVTSELRTERLPIFLSYQCKSPVRVSMSLWKGIDDDNPLFSKEFDPKKSNELVGGMTQELTVGRHYAVFSTADLANFNHMALIVGDKTAGELIEKLAPSPKLPKKGRQFDIAYRLKVSCQVVLNVIDGKGDEIAKLYSGDRLGGQDYQASWSSEKRAEGMYVVQLQAKRGRAQPRLICAIQVGD